MTEGERGHPSTSETYDIQHASRNENARKVAIKKKKRKKMVAPSQLNYINVEVGLPLAQKSAMGS